MHVAMIIDEERLLHEHAVLKRLAVGLIDNGIKLTRIVPDEIHSEPVALSEQRMALAPRLEAAFAPLPWLRRGRTARLAESLDRSPPDVIFAIGYGAWRLGLDLAEVMGKPAALSVHSSHLVRLAPRPRGSHGRFIAAYIAATASLGEALRGRIDDELVSVVPMGVAIPREPAAVLQRTEDSVAVAIIGPGKKLHAYRAMLEGLREARERHPQIQAVMELRAGSRTEIWRLARKLNLHDAISFIEEASLHRSLLTRCDVLLIPERTGEVSSLVLECMAFGMPVIAKRDPCMDFLRADETAAIIDKPDPEQWAAHLTRLIESPAEARSLGAAGRSHIASRHSSSLEVKSLAETLERVLKGEAYPFRSVVA